MIGNWLLDRVMSDFWPFRTGLDSPHWPFMPNRDDHFHPLVEKEVSDDGLIVTTRFNFDFDRDFDLISISTTTVLANGDRQVVVDFRDEADTLLRKTSTTTSDSGNSKVTTIDLDGDGQIDRQLSFVKADDGTIVRTLSEYSEGGDIKSQERYTFNSSDKTFSYEWDRDGDGQFEGSWVWPAKHDFGIAMLWSVLGSGQREQGLPNFSLDGEDGLPWASWNDGDGGRSEISNRFFGDDTGTTGPGADVLASWGDVDHFDFFGDLPKYEEGIDASYPTVDSGFAWVLEHGSSHPTGDWGRTSEDLIDDAGHLLHQHEPPPISLANDGFLFV